MASVRIIALLPFLGVLAASPAAAQFPNIFDTIFGNPQQRPPADIPDRPPAPFRGNPQYLPPPSGGLPPGPPPGARIRTEPLPPPPGATASPPPTRITPQPGTGQPGTPPGQPPTQSASLPPQPPPPAETIVEPPPHRIPNPTAVFSGLDKITGRIISFDVAINETVRFGALEVTPRACYTRPPTEAANTDGFIEVDEVTLQGELKRIFNGWMFAASPGLNAVEHPIYDVWLTDCKGGEKQEVAADAPAPPPPAAKPPARPQPQRRTSQQQPQLPPPPAPPAR
jgi:hypothetical protein